MKSFITMLLLFPFFVFGQSTFTISGTIQTSSKAPIPYANIVLDDNSYYAISDENGFFEIKDVKRGNYTITISSIGYSTKNQTIQVNQNLQLNFILEDNVENLDDVIVSGKKTSTEQAEKAITISSFELADVATQTNILTDAVDKISGVRIRRSGSLGDESDISINGLNGTAVRTYIDGIPLEFLYPRLDLANIPLSGIKRVDVYKGVLPVDVGTDALGGGINIITESNYVNRIRASYSVGSFNTHLGDFSVTLTDKTEGYLKIIAGTNYSDNDYTFKADLKVNDPFTPGQFITLEDQNIQRFHDAYRLQYSSATLGTANKKWADKIDVSFNYLNAYREIQNGLRINNEAIGEAVAETENVSVVLKYDKTLLKEKLKLRTISNYSDELITFVDTTSNVYNWLGDIIDVNSFRQGEFNNGSPSYTDSKTKNWVNRSTLDLKLWEGHKLTLSNIFANQRRGVRDFDIDNPNEFFDIPKQKITKNITGLQYDGAFLKEKIEFSSALKYYSYSLEGLSFFRTNPQPISQNRSFFGWNAGLKYQMTKDLSFRGSYERGFLIPEIFQFAGNATGIISNGEIRPEESDNYNLGFLFFKRFNENYALTLTSNAFLRKQRDIIFLNINQTPLQYKNAESVDSKGIEGELKVNFLKNFNWITNVSYIDKTFESFDSQPSNDFLIGSPFPNTPVFFYNTQLSWRTNDLFNSGIGANIYGLYTHVDEFNIIPVGKEDTIANSPNAFIPEQNRLDFGLALTFFEKKITTAFNIVNITDEDLFDNFSIPRPGRNFNFKFIYEISNF